MKIFNIVLSILRPVKFLIAAFTCALLFLSSTVPAFAIESYQSEPTEATTQLLETQRKTDEVARSAPPSLREVQKKSNEGLNEVQGAADIEKMKRPENSQSSTSVEEEVKNFLEKVTGNK
ncbi:hypothetical protein Nos7524_5106 [Nostoc sp. PCC 7524]|uniref:hypothetical protein n=1 Tax=Nostoc sp. (strain ATCC 29411 / PCC 7524) TaxID=28072 RepID=UPI00029F1A5C|nr:hypothetical protein [Nostoc sp. PCC 7524]AFY50831.1 hypothetical protein Nos7524_5106 [Nostoc sp. PCC 7524]